MAGVGIGKALGAALEPGQVAWADSVSTKLRLVIGRTQDLTKPGAIGADEFTLLEQLTPDLGSPRANWYRNASVLRRALRNGVAQIRDASPGDTEGVFLNAERNLLRNRGWTFDPNTNLWSRP